MVRLSHHFKALLASLFLALPICLQARPIVTKPDRNASDTIYHQHSASNLPVNAVNIEPRSYEIIILAGKDGNDLPDVHIKSISFKDASKGPPPFIQGPPQAGKGPETGEPPEAKPEAVRPETGSQSQGQGGSDNNHGDGPGEGDEMDELPGKADEGGKPTGNEESQSDPSKSGQPKKAGKSPDTSSDKPGSEGAKSSSGDGGKSSTGKQEGADSSKPGGDQGTAGGSSTSATHHGASRKPAESATGGAVENDKKPISAKHGGDGKSEARQGEVGPDRGSSEHEEKGKDDKKPVREELDSGNPGTAQGRTRRVDEKHSTGGPPHKPNGEKTESSKGARPVTKGVPAPPHGEHADMPAGHLEGSKHGESGHGSHPPAEGDSAGGAAKKPSTSPKKAPEKSKSHGVQSKDLSDADQAHKSSKKPDTEGSGMFQPCMGAPLQPQTHGGPPFGGPPTLVEV